VVTLSANGAATLAPPAPPVLCLVLCLVLCSRTPAGWVTIWVTQLTICSTKARTVPAVIYSTPPGMTSLMSAPHPLSAPHHLPPATDLASNSLVVSLVSLLHLYGFVVAPPLPSQPFAPGGSHSSRSPPIVARTGHPCILAAAPPPACAPLL
jgi:hypothetical protein